MSTDAGPAARAASLTLCIQRAPGPCARTSAARPLPPVRTAAMRPAGPYFRRCGASPSADAPGPCRLYAVVVASIGPRSRVDLRTDVALVIVSAAAGLLLLVTKFPETRGPGWVPGPAALAFAVDACLGAVSCAAIW